MRSTSVVRAHATAATAAATAPTLSRPARTLQIDPNSHFGSQSHAQVMRNTALRRCFIYGILAALSQLTTFDLQTSSSEK